MNGFLFRFLLGAAGLAFAVLIVPGLEVRGPFGLLAAALSVGAACACLRPALTRFFPPPTVLGFGLALLALDAVMIGLVAAAWDGFVVDGPWPAVMAAVVAGLTGWIADSVADEPVPRPAPDADPGV